MPRNLPYFLAIAICFLFAERLRGEPVESPNDLVEIQKLDPTIQVELKYATTDNITGRVLYPAKFKAQLRRGVMEELMRAQATLRPMGYGLKIWDAYRSLDVQKALFAVISDPRYVATPGVHSMHNRAAAVDVTLVDANGRELEMPTKFDVMGPRASYFYSAKDPAVLKRLVLLQRVMSQSGFYACRTEWWHFFSRRWEKYPNVPEPNTGKKKGAIPEPST
ncbi:MAG: M15 family metallopeptidase [Chthoniobacterales bacterium]